MQLNVHGVNKYIAYSYSKNLPLTQLLCLTHPLDRLSFAKRLLLDGLITKYEYESINNNKIELK